MDIIEVHGYTHLRKNELCTNIWVPKAITDTGLQEDNQFNLLIELIEILSLTIPRE